VPHWRRFLNADTFFIAGDDSLNGSNMYAYCNGNPVMFVDPTGMAPAKRPQKPHRRPFWDKKPPAANLGSSLAAGGVTEKPRPEHWSMLTQLAAISSKHDYPTAVMQPFRNRGRVRLVSA